MNKTWVDKEKEGLANLIRQNESEIRNIIDSVPYLNSDQKERILKLSKRSTAELSDACDQIVMELLEAGYSESIKELREQLKTIIDLCKANSMLNKEIKYKDKFYLDSEVKEFDGECIAAIHRMKDDDDKLVVAPIGKTYTKEQIEALVEFQERFFEHEIIEKC